MVKKISLIIISLLCLGLAGCIIEEVPLTEAEFDVVAQYAADRLMAYDNNNEKWTVDPRLLTPTPTNTPTPTATNTPVSTPKPAKPTSDPNATPVPTNTPTPTTTPTPFPSNTTETWKQLAKVIGAEEFEVRFMGASEPEKSFTLGGSYYPLSKVPGYEHLAVKIQIWNRTSETLYLNVHEMQIESVIMINDDLPRRQETTMFMNELRYIGIQSGGKGEAVLPYEKYNGDQGAVIVFLIPEGIDIERAGLGITNKNGDEVIIKIQ